MDPWLLLQEEYCSHHGNNDNFVGIASQKSLQVKIQKVFQTN